MKEEKNSFEVEEFEKFVARRILEVRKERKMSQLDLSIEAGISQGYLAMIEAHKKIPTITTIFKIAKALNIRVEKLLSPVNTTQEEVKQKLIRFIEANL